MNINTRQAQGSLVVMYLLFLSASLGAILYLELGGKIFGDEAVQALLVLIESYSVPLGIIFAGIFALGKSRAQKVQANPYIVAIAVSLIWNLLLVWRTAAYVTAARGDVQIYIEGIQDVAAQASFLVAGALTFFFVKR